MGSFSFISTLLLLHLGDGKQIIRSVKPDSMVLATVDASGDLDIIEAAPASTCGMNTPGQCLNTSVPLSCYGSPGSLSLVRCSSLDRTGLEQGQQQPNNFLTAFIATLPSPVGNFFQDLIGNMNSNYGGKVTLPIRYPLCWGDQTGSWISARQDYQVSTFLNRLWIPENEDVWGSFGFHALGPCGRFSMAFTVRTCTPSKVNFAFSFSPAAFICNAGNPLAAALKTVTEFSFGMSLDRALGGYVQVVTGDGVKASLNRVFAPMHFFISGQLSMGLENFFSSLPKGFFTGFLQGVLGVSFDLASIDLLTSIINNGASAVPDYLKSLVKCAAGPVVTSALAGFKTEGLSNAALSMISACVGGFTMTTRVTGGFMVNLDLLSSGLLPPLTVNLVQETIVTKVSPKKAGAAGTDGLDKGFYLYRDALTGSPSDIVFFANRLLTRVSGLFDALGLSIGTVSFPAVGGGAGLYVTDAGCGFLARVAINSNSMDLTCNFKFSNLHLGCTGLGLNTLIDMFLDGANWVINTIKDGITTLYSKIPADKIKDTAISISKDIVNEGKCVYTTIADGAKCGFQTVTDAALCGKDVITDGAKCGFETVSQTITDAAKCGTQSVQCGVQTIRDGARCGWNCFTGLFSGQTACSCNVPKYCDQARSCSVSVQRGKTCDLPKSCSVPKTCSVLASC